MLLFALDSATAMFVAGAMLVTFVLMRRSQKRMSLSKLPPVSPPARSEQPASAHHLDAPQAFGRWEVAMHELARDLSGQLDTKIAIVQQLVVDAERASQRLEAAVAQASALGRRPDVDDYGLPSSEALERQNGAAQSLALDERGEQASRLADRGLSHAAIADELGVPLGEVELMLSVRGK